MYNKFLIMCFIVTSPLSLASNERKVIVFLGDSITAGAGVSKSQAFPAQLQNIVDANNLNLDIRDAGVSGDTTAGGLRRINWILKSKPHLVIVFLGGNDGMRNIPKSHTQENLVKIIKKVKKSGSKVALVSMQIPQNFGIAYTKNFSNIFPEVSKSESIPLIPFINNFLSQKQLFQRDGIHPTNEGHKIIAQHFYDVFISKNFESRTSH